MAIKIADVPQANSLRTVLLTALAVHNGAKTYQQIAKAVGFTERQARYYRRACELLGIVVTKTKNSSCLSEAGALLLKEIKYDTNNVKALKSLILNIPIISEVLDFFENDHDFDEAEILDRFVEVSGFNGDSATARRRLSTFVAWMKEIDLFTKPPGTKTQKRTYRIHKSVKETKGPATKYVTAYDSFIKNINLHIKVPYEYTIGDEDYEALEQLLTLEKGSLIEEWLNKDRSQKIARLLTFKSETDTLEIPNILSEKEFFKSIDLTHGRLLIETDRALRGLSSSISKGGNALEALMTSYCKANNLDYKQNHLFKGLNKNVDFFIPELNLAIECKYSKSSGTKHGGALKDLMEQSKGKKAHSYKLGVLIAGKQFIEDREFCSSVFNLLENDFLDLVITPADLMNLPPKKLLEVSRDSIQEKDLEIVVEGETTWSSDLSPEEVGLDDACRWLNRFLSINFLNFRSRLYTWVNQTPFAVQVLRLIIGWSESKMSSFVKAAIDERNISWKKEVSSFKDVSFLVDSLVDNLTPDEIEDIERFFFKEVSLMDFLVVRESALRGSAIRKKNTSKIFVQSCKANSEFEVIEESFTQELPSGAKVKSNFKIKKDSRVFHVLCKYYAGSGSVMSDFVKTMCELSEIGKQDEWFFIVDGPGWLDREKDMNRMISHVEANGLNFYNLYSWSAWKRAS